MRCCLTGWGVTVVAVVVAASGARAGASLSLDTSVVLSSAGLSLRPFEGYASRPLNPIDAATYVNRRTGQRIDAYEPRALWMQDQLQAVLAGESGEITVARLQYNVLEGVPLINGRHVTREVYEGVRDAQRQDWTIASVAVWVQEFTGEAPVGFTRNRPGLRLRHPHVWMRFRGIPEERMQACVVLLPDRPTLFLFRFAAGLSRQAVDRGVAQFLASVSPVRRREADPTHNAAFQDPGGRRLAARDRSPERTAARERVLRSIRDLPDWWYTETSNYVLVSNLGSRNRRLVDLIQKDVEILRTAFELLVAPRAEITEVSIIKVFRERDEYLSYVGPEMQWSAGVWAPSRKELVVAPADNLRTTRDLRKMVLSVVYHEGFHQYLYYALAGQEVPIWLNEGHATLLEACSINHTRKVLHVGENPQWLPVVEALVAQPRGLDLKALMTMDQERFYVSGRHGAQAQRKREAHYALAWGLTYFLRKAGPLYPDRRYRGLCQRIVDVSAEQGSWRAGAEAGLEAVDLEQLTADFVAFWQDRRLRRRAERTLLFSGRR